MSVARVAAPAKPYRVIECPDRATWLEVRRTLGVGSSEVSALFSRPDQPLAGLSSWASPLSLSYEKRGLSERPTPDPEDEARTDWGLRQEPTIAQWFADRVLPEVEPFAEVVNPGDHTIFACADGFPLFATVDRLIVQDGEPLAELEIKNAATWMAGEWDEEPPFLYTLQVQAQLAVTGLPVGYLCACIGGEPPKWAKVKRDEEIIAIIRQRVAAFWQTVMADVDPVADAHPKTAAALLSRWPRDNGAAVKLEDSHLELWEERCRMHETIVGLELRKDLATNKLKQSIGEATFGELPGGRLLTLRADKRGNRILREKANG